MDRPLTQAYCTATLKAQFLLKRLQGHPHPHNPLIWNDPIAWPEGWNSTSLSNVYPSETVGISQCQQFDYKFNKSQHSAWDCKITALLFFFLEILKLLAHMQKNILTKLGAQRRIVNLYQLFTGFLHCGVPLKPQGKREPCIHIYKRF